ncbi:MAG: Wzy polymerase domain-containing protein [Burkholderiaceae bacterium]
MALCQWLGPSVWEGLLDPHIGRRPFANIGQPNHLSTQLLLGVAGALYWYETRRSHGWPTAFVVAWLGVGIVLTESRTGWLSVFVIALWWWWMRERAALRLRALPLAIGITCFAIAVFCLGRLHLLVGAVDPDAVAPTALRLEAGTRPLHWAMLLDALGQSPWWGYGWSQVANAQFVVSANHPATGEWLTQSHNLVLDLLIYNGIPIGALLSTMMLLWFVRHSRACNNSTSWSLLLALFMLFTHALLENPLHYAYFLLPAGLLIGVLSSDCGVERRWHGRRSSLAVPIALLLVPLTVVSAEYFDAEENLRRMELSFKGVGTKPAALPQHEWFLVDGWAAYHRASTLTISTGMRRQDLDELRKVASRYPYPNILMQYAHASAMNANPEAARRSLIHACKVFGPPTCQQMRKLWLRLQSSEPLLRDVEFPTAVD